MDNGPHRRDPWRRRGVRLAAGATLLACAAVGGVGIAGAVADGGPSIGPPEIQVLAPGESVPDSSAPTAPPAPDVGQMGAATGATQAVSVSILGGGIRLDPEMVTVELTRASDGSLRGRVQSVRVVDARGTLGGWALVATSDAVVSAPDGSHLLAQSIEVHDAHVAPFDGQSDGLRPGRDGVLGANGTTLATAAAGSGGGTYLVGADIVVRTSRPVPRSATVVIDLALVAR